MYHGIVCSGGSKEGARKEEKPARHARFDELTIVTCPSM